MNLGIIPIIMTVVVTALCGIGAVLGGLMLLDASARPLGRQILRCAGISFLAGVVFTWAGLLPCGIVWNFNEHVAVLMLWGSGPAGVLFGMVWHAMGWPVGRRSKPMAQSVPTTPFKSPASASGSEALQERENG